jgi:hypothetical protein
MEKPKKTVAELKTIIRKGCPKCWDHGPRLGHGGLHATFTLMYSIDARYRDLL